MDNEKIVGITFILYNGMNYTQWGYKLKDARAIMDRFTSFKNNPEKGIVMTYEGPDDSGKALAIDLKNIIGVFIA